MAIGLAMALPACNGATQQQETNSNAGAVEVVQDTTQTSTKKKMSAKEQLAFSQEDLAARLDVELDTVSISGATPVTWRSGALGCPEPGMNYTQALVPGIWIMLRVSNTPYRYHAIPGGQPFYCPDDRAEPPVTGSGAD